MKLLKDMNAAMSPVMIVLIILAAAVVAIALMGVGPADDGTPTADDLAVAAIAGQETGTLTLTLLNQSGNQVASDSGIDVYLTSPDVYADVYEVYEEVSANGRLVSPYDPADVAGSKQTTPGAAGAIEFIVTASAYEAGSATNTGTAFGIAIIDSGVAVGDYNPEIGNILVTARLNNDLDVVVNAVENIPGYLGAQIEVAQRGTLSFYDALSGADSKTGYKLDMTTNTSLEDQDFDLNVRLTGDDTEVRDIVVYVEVADDVAGTLDMVLDDVEISVNGVKLTGTSLGEVSDLSSADPLRKNAPAAILSGTVYVVEGAMFDLARINSDNYDKAVITLVDYDATVVASDENDAGSFVVNLVANNGHKDSEMAASPFTVNMTEDGDNLYT